VSAHLVRRILLRSALFALQLTLPQWVRSRGASICILIFMRAMATGSIGWGVAAQGLGTPLACRHCFPSDPRRTGAARAERLDLAE